MPRWMASKVAVELGTAVVLKPSEEKSNTRIDDIVAAIMALGRAILQPTHRRSYYEHTV